MVGSVIDPALFASTPFNNRTALIDLAGQLELYHRVLAETISRTTQQAVKMYPLGAGRGEPAWLDALTKQSADERRVLGLAPPPDYSVFDLRDPSEWASFCFILSGDLQAVRIAAGVV